MRWRAQSTFLAVVVPSSFAFMFWLDYATKHLVDPYLAKCPTTDDACRAKVNTHFRNCRVYLHNHQGRSFWPDVQMQLSEAGRAPLVTCMNEAE